MTHLKTKVQFFFLVIFMLISRHAASQLQIKGSIKPSKGWQKKMYIIRMDYLELMPPVLLDSIPMDEDGSFCYSFKNYSPQGLLYKIVLPPEGGSYRTQIDGYADNFFLVTLEESGVLEVSADADSLYYSYKIDRQRNTKGYNSSLIHFREIKKPLFRLAKQLEDSIRSNSSGANQYRQKFVPEWMHAVEVARPKIINVLDTTKNASITLAGLFYLYGANFGNIDKTTIEKYEHNLRSYPDVLLVNNILSLKEDAQANRIDKIVPDLELQGINDSSMSVYSLPRGKLIIDFWASWCSPCRYANKFELPQLYEKIKERNIDLVGISIDKDASKWRAAVEKDKIPWPNFRDMSSALESFLGVNTVPLYIVLDENRKIIFEARSVSQLTAFLAE